MKRRILAGILAAAFCTLHVRAQEPDVTVESTATKGAWVGAEAAVVVEAKTGRILFGQQENRQLPIASTTKILTALIALEQPDIYATFAVDEEAIKVEGSSMGLQPGDQASLHSLAVGMLLASGNDGANAAAVRISGSIPDFANVMNMRAESIGMTRSHFETPSGLDKETHYSTAYDMALLAREALRNNDFYSICSQYRLQAEYGNPPYTRWLVNHNKLLNYCEGVVGVKTGFTKRSGRCLVSAAERDGITLICVTLNCPDDWTVHENLYERYFKELEMRDMALELPLSAMAVTGGVQPEVPVVTYSNGKVPLPVGNPQVVWRTNSEPFLYAPVQAGRYIGEATAYVDGIPMCTLTLVAGQDVAERYPYEEKLSLAEKIAGLWSKLTG